MLPLNFVAPLLLHNIFLEGKKNKENLRWTAKFSIFLGLFKNFKGNFVFLGLSKGF